MSSIQKQNNTSLPKYGTPDINSKKVQNITELTKIASGTTAKNILRVKHLIFDEWLQNSISKTNNYGLVR